MTWARQFAGQRDLLIAGLYVLGAAAMVFGPFEILRAAAIVPLVLFVPGYALVSALFPALEVPTVERVLIAVALSIGATILLGLVLAFSGIGLTTLSWLVALAAVSLVGLGVAAARRARLGIIGPDLRLATMPRLGVLAVAVALLVIGNVVLGSRLVAGDQQSSPPLQLWMIPVAGQRLSAELGVHADDAGGRYSVVISSAGEVVREYNPTLGPQETWQTVVQFTPEVRSRPIVARLYEPGLTVESRFVVLQPVTSGS